ncbi:MAG TPA: endolytic transglycosylase MltG [Candidatus Paceibacterota bacterium]
MIIIVSVLVTAFIIFGLSYDGLRELTTNVDLENKIITEDSDGGAFSSSLSWFRDVVGEGLMAFTGSQVYQNLAFSDARYIYVREGLRREETGGLFATHLDWDAKEQDLFASASEGMYYPGTYLLSKRKNSEIVRELMLNRFEREITDRYSTSTKKIISIPTAIKIASLIEREASGKSDMRLISGIIWNRIFKNMPLQIDATLQYAKGSEKLGWWPAVLPEDKEMDSPYNTYKHKGFPPAPIASPGITSVYAALNPTKTDCLFYLHDKRRRIHCAVTYEGHKRNIEKYYYPASMSTWR